MSDIRPINITAAALITQFFLVIIMFVGAMILKRGESRGSPHHADTAPLPWIILFLFIITIGFLGFSEDLIPVWRPLFGSATFPSVPTSVALLVMFTVDSVCLAVVVFLTGGSRTSAFGPMFFILPALAIFLREPLGRVLWYFGLTASLFSLCLLTPESVYRQREGRTDIVAYWVLAVLCLVLTTFVGYVTRPR